MLEDMPSDEIVDIVIEDDRWEDAGLPEMAERAARAVGEWLDLERFQIVVMGCDDTRIAALNAEFRGKPTPTNVLSWPASEFEPRDPGAHPEPPPDEELGDIAISFDTCAREAQAQNKPFADHATHLLVHAMLHLAGYDHIDDMDAETMEDAERSILGKLGIPDPYLEPDR
ncbi:MULTISPECIES: rRNA maturation RNase YbeY [unclassified Paracoccus (in: a-proteobacteria)]|uniref:rRNA maturation RNase YbeY n=1 Tax=unclassified Paracoccus (in: a-proteobacteria) TaxID=2688777 RepID=UPI0018A6CB87|nr:MULTISPECIES: rRNA maturation RNase YbeY [unclassified Paracoccus (in: a-proteobacteria)]UXU74252.1 rRNA maturation RNase YbeY [Paracoccus sp. SMMA_5]UXU80142.1 rRNA maturation RNase YbeY [Paracoccus sp. SMMA_5_TC]